MFMENMKKECGAVVGLFLLASLFVNMRPNLYLVCELCGNKK